MNTDQKPILSIVIVSYNVKDLLLDCIHSINKYISVPKEVIVIDNASADNTCEVLKEKFSEVRIIESKTNLGFSAANNLGFEIAKGEYILMLNPDAALINSSFTKAFDYLKQHSSKNLIIGPRIFNPDGSFQHSAWKFPKLRQHFLESIFLNKWIDTTSYKNLNSTEEIMEVDFLSGAGLLMSKETQQNIGNLDEHLFWMDDVDFCYRNKINGGESLYFPKWQISHHIGQSSKKNRGLVLSNQLISKLKFYRKQKKHFTYFVSIFIFQLHIFLRLVFLLPSITIPSETNPLAEKLRAYIFAQKKFWKYIFLGDGSIS